MWQRVASWCGALVVICLLVSPAAAQKPKEKKVKEKPSPYVIMVVGEEPRAVKQSEVKAEEKRIGDEYKAALEQYRQRKKEAAKNKEKITDPEPKKPKFIYVGGVYPTQEKADEAIELWREKQQEAKDAAAAKGGGKKKR